MGNEQVDNYILVVKIIADVDFNLGSKTIKKNHLYYLASKQNEASLCPLVREEDGIIAIAVMLVESNIEHEMLAFMREEQERTLRTPFGEEFDVLMHPLSQGEINDLYSSMTLIKHWNETTDEPFLQIKCVVEDDVHIENEGENLEEDDVLDDDWEDEDLA